MEWKAFVTGPNPYSSDVFSHVFSLHRFSEARAHYAALDAWAPVKANSFPLGNSCELSSILKEHTMNMKICLTQENN